MKPTAVSACLLLTVALFVTVRGTEHPDPAVKTTLVNNLSAMPLAFTQNKCQWPNSILYRANAGGATMWFTLTGAYYQFTRRVPSANDSGTSGGAPGSTFRPNCRNSTV